MSDYKGSAQEKADKAYRQRISADEAKRLERNYKSRFRAAKSFINEAEKEDITELLKLIDSRFKLFAAHSDDELYIFTKSEVHPPSMWMTEDDMLAMIGHFEGDKNGLVPYGSAVHEDLNVLKKAYTKDEYSSVLVFRYTGIDLGIGNAGNKLYRFYRAEFNLPGERKVCYGG